MFRELAVSRLAAATETALAVAPGLEVEQVEVVGSAARVLYEESAHAELVVVDDGGLGGFPGLQVGSVPAALAPHADCPVVVVQGTDGGRAALRGDPVVVGVDGAPVSDAALGFAFDAASLRSVPLVACGTCRWTR